MNATSRLGARRQMIRTCEIAEARDFRFERQVDRARRTVELLADDNLGATVRALDLALPIQELLRTLARLFVCEIIFLAEEQDNHVGILLDRAGFTQFR